MSLRTLEKIAYSVSAGTSSIAVFCAIMALQGTSVVLSGRDVAYFATLSMAALMISVVLSVAVDRREKNPKNKT